MKRLILVLMSCGLAGCFADRQGELYGLKDGSKASVLIQDGPGNKGVAHTTLTSGEQCEGKYNTVPGDITYSLEDMEHAKELTQSGMLLLTCNQGHVIQCEFSRYPKGAGYGTCRDTKGAEYSLMF